MNLNEDIGIGIIDVYQQQNLDSCLESIPEDLKDNVYIVSNTNNKIKNFNHTRFDREISFACLRNQILSEFRLNKKKYLFMIYSNYAITEKDFFTDAVKSASLFGTWLMTGPSDNFIELEDEVSKTPLKISPELNAEVLFMFSGLVKKFGYFNEQLHSNNQLELLDYILKLRKEGLYPSNHFNPILHKGLYKVPCKLNKINSSKERADELTFGMFQHLHNYVPGFNDPPGITQEQLFQELERIQQTYAKPL
jgi:hypothetical protein